MGSYLIRLVLVIAAGLDGKIRAYNNANGEFYGKPIPP
jgi:hypothetical protein